MSQEATQAKPVRWVASTRMDLRSFPRQVRRTVGFSLWLAQRGWKHGDAKPLKGFGDASVVEIVEDHDSDTYRAVYTVRFVDGVYVLHVFQKKAKKGIATPKRHLDLIRKRLSTVEAARRRR